MPSTWSAPVSAESVLRLRMRPDLQIRPHWYGQRRHWVVKDPLSFKYFHLLDEEHAILQMLDGRASLASIQQHFERQFAPYRISLPRLQSFLGDLHQRGLILSDAPGQGGRLLERRGQQARRTWLQAWGNLLAIRLPGVDPDRFLERLAPRCAWLLTPAALSIWLLVVLAAIALVTVHHDQLWARLPDFRSFFHAGNLVWLALSMAVVKVLHELGHAVACKHFGGECHDLGLMFLIFTPCLYCDVSDAWMLPGKWQRIAVSAAGLYVELFLAAVCTFLWWFSEPGLLNSLFLNIMFVCSVSAVVFNGNPLMRFDGYYILADLVEIPNLQSRARSALSRLVARWTLGVDVPGERAIAQRRHGWLAAYAAAAIGYRWLVVIGCLFFLNAVLKPYRLEILAQAFMGITVLGMAAGPTIKASRFVHDPLRRHQIRSGRLAGSLAVVLLVLAALVFMPVPYRVQAPLLLQPQDARYIYVTASGTLQTAIADGQSAGAGETLARLADEWIELELAALVAERQQQDLHVRYLESQRGRDLEAAAQIPTARERLTELDEQLQQVRRRQQLLHIRAPVAGTVIAPPRRTDRSAAAGRLPTWPGTPLDPENLGSYLPAGTLLCLIGDPSRQQVIALIDQAEIEFIDLGQRVALRLNQLPGQRLTGTITDVAKIDLQAVPPQLAVAGGLATRQERGGGMQPMGTIYQARIALDQHDRHLAPGGTGRCKIVVAPQPLGQRLLRFLSRTFTWNLFHATQN